LIGHKAAGHWLTSLSENPTPQHPVKTINPLIDAITSILATSAMAQSAENESGKACGVRSHRNPTVVASVAKEAAEPKAAE
jgi:hypothetical protein